MNFPVPNFLLIAAALAPALFLLALLTFLPKSATRWSAPRPLQTVVIATLTGIASAEMALVVEGWLTKNPWQFSSLGVLALFSLVVAGCAEEGAKYLCVRLYSWRLPVFREPFDGLLYCGAVGLGFGAIENISYVSQGGLGTALTRALTAVPFHGMLGLVLGYFLGQAKVRQLAGERWGGLHAQGLIFAILLHGLYDLFAFQSSLPSEIALYALLLGMGLWSVRTIRSTRAISPSWGGSTPPPPPPFVPPPLVERNPVVAAVLGLFPGVGQFYNREYQKGFFLLAAGVLNLVLLAVVWLLLNVPQLLVVLLVVAGLDLNIRPQDLEMLSNSPVLTVLAVLNAALCLVSAFDAYRTARTNRFDYLEPPEKRVRTVQSFSASYMGHLLALFLAVLVPVIVGGKARSESKQSGQPGAIEFDLVTTPKKLDGFSGKPEGTAKGKDKRNAPKISAQKSPTVKAPGPAPKPQAAQEAQGLPRSYNEYLSWKIRRYHDLYFDQVGQGQYTVVQYDIDAVGNVSNVQVLYDHTTAPSEVAELAAETVRRLDPALPLPPGIQMVTITELFWDGSPIGSPGSLEEHLSELPDGREVEPYPPQPRSNS
ncbi:PrsW family intramembrane metalloprotease [Gloeobacter kilaueensis]|uniref:Protease PrsW n=1 Tax=Gloeobacter kilaueensis (strain ATCC BAA-2537 / CCAP 1431/1 / ULC 316 / JS1) TaxID=1183438 RepID=U5QIN3_GLOK1|nr:PrsW family glutamic-type intramembrane protease [Gloeobacter kilaueensis]AGY57530.1 hypothetical protein GKIL_1284 [Gloeobacter kilaueensis JS1]